MGQKLWPGREEIAAPTTTAVRAPAGFTSPDVIRAARDLYGVTFSSGRGETHEKLVRIGHMGPVAEPIGKGPELTQLREQAKRIAQHDAAVLITGEAGSGKEVVARSIHRLGANSAAPFIAVNLAAVPHEMVESELFGHEKGAFTGAESRRGGLLRTAQAGTVFLDEIAELSPAVQAKLLRVLESHEVRPLGSDTMVPFEARIVAATHRDLPSRVEEGTFREDLFYRLNVLRIHIPPLRARPDDVPPLVHDLLRRHAARSGIAEPIVSAEAMRAMCGHVWRGNVRELSNVLERAIILAEQGRIDPEHLPEDIRGDAVGGLHLSDAVARAERTHIAMVLKFCDGNRERAAEELGISPATLYRRLERLAM
jgi:DNA-binding NtrC family response regulator